MYEKGIDIFSDNAGVGLVDLDTDLHLTNFNGSMSVQVPEGFDKTIDYTGNNGSGSLALDDDAKDYLLTLSAQDSAVSLPPEFPAFTPNQVWEYQNGSGEATIKLTVQDSSFSVAVNDDKK